MSESTYTQHKIVPFVDLDDDDLHEKTIRHHKKRYLLASDFVQPKTFVLDICCGTGYGTDILKKAGAMRVLGIDVSEEAILKAKSKYTENHYLQSDLMQFFNNLEDKDFQPSLVTFFEAIEHIDKRYVKEAFNRIRKLMAPEGIFLLSTPRDIRRDVNPDHISEWSFEELQDELYLYFENVEMLGQDWHSGEFTKNNPQHASFFIACCRNPKQ